MVRQKASPVRVFKFGGTSVGTAEALRTAAGHVEADDAKLVVVVSAMAGITDLLLAGARAARDQDADRLWDFRLVWNAILNWNDLPATPKP